MNARAALDRQEENCGASGPQTCMGKPQRGPDMTRCYDRVALPGTGVPSDEHPPLLAHNRLRFTLICAHTARAGVRKRTGVEVSMGRLRPLLALAGSVFGLSLCPVPDACAEAVRAAAVGESLATSAGVDVAAGERRDASPSVSELSVGR